MKIWVKGRVTQALINLSWTLAGDSGIWTLRVRYFGFRGLIRLIRLQLCRELKHVYMTLGHGCLRINLNLMVTRQLSVIGSQHSPVS